MNTVNAEYVTTWNDGTELRSTCEYDPATKQVTNVIPVDVTLDPALAMDREFVVLGDGTEAPVAR